jgi:protein TonB
MLVSNTSVLRRAPPSLIIVGGLHLVALWALMNGLNIHPLATHSRDMTATMIDQSPPVDEPPPKPDVHLSEINFTPPPPEPWETAPVVSELPPQPEALGMTPPVIDTVPAGSAEPKQVINGASVDPRHPLTQPDYPMEARHFGEEGRVTLSILVGADGRVLDAKATQSSGSVRLDQAAIKEARLHWRLRPALRNGVPFEQWLTVPVVFRLEIR